MWNNIHIRKNEEKREKKLFFNQTGFLVLCKSVGLSVKGHLAKIKKIDFLVKAHHTLPSEEYLVRKSFLFDCTDT